MVCQILFPPRAYPHEAKTEDHKDKHYYFNHFKEKLKVAHYGAIEGKSEEKFTLYPVLRIRLHFKVISPPKVLDTEIGWDG